MNDKPIYWNLSNIWNECAFKENRDLKARDYIYASELGMPLVDRYLKMKAVPYTNPPNNRSLRKFLAGNIWEHVVKQILVASGVFQHDEVKVDATPYTDSLEVHGRLDFKAGGIIDAGKAFDRLNQLALPDYLETVGRKIIEALEGKHLRETILELKSCSTFAMDKVERSKAAMPNHTLQGYHYQKNSSMQAAIAYICKDDCRMAQFDVNADSCEPLYKKDIEEMTYFYTKGKQPPNEPLLKFDDQLGKFSKNLGIEYSPYLSKLYGFETPDDYRNAIGHVDKWNRTLTRYALIEAGTKTKTGKDMVISPKNKESRAEIEKAGYRFDTLLQAKIALGALEEEED
jgi:hypothetical protein